MKRIALLSIIFCVSIFSTACNSSGGGLEDLSDAQNDERVGRDITRCGVEEVSEDVIIAVNDVIADTSAVRLSRDNGSVNVPVVFHVVASGPSEAEGNVSDEIINEQIRILNESFNGGSGATATPFTFTLVETTRTISPALTAMNIGSAIERQVKENLRRGGPETLNIYSAAPSDGVLGYAYFPWDFMRDPTLDGVVILFETLPQGSLPPYNEGDTLVHEVGHWLGLFHSFQGSCSALNDNISDTPAENRPAFGCPVGRNTCAGDSDPDPVNNFMDYSDDFCLFDFTPQQVQRMDILAQRFRL
jgi:predicted small secreted protein